MKVLIVNAGSSSLKYQLVDMDNEQMIVKGQVERIAIEGSHLNQKTPDMSKVIDLYEPIPDHVVATKLMLRALLDPEKGVLKSVDEIGAVGHRVLHGGEEFTASCIITDEVKAAIRKFIPLGPLHNPANLMGIEACEEVMPHTPQVAVFDTAFHQTMPPKAFMYGVPYRYYKEMGVRRYGFHGTSHRFVSKRCIELMGAEKASRVIVRHLGNGSSLSAVKDGKCQDTSMGLSPLAGVPMGTRAGDIDTCVAQYMMNHDKLTADECLNILNKKSGVLALSGISSDFRDIETAANQGNEDCRLALDKFAYEVKKYIGSYTTVLGGLDCLVFTAGVGENSATMRASICEGLEYLGIKLDPEKNNTRGEEAIISAADSKVTVWVIPTNEELMIAQDTAELCK